MSCTLTLSEVREVLAKRGGGLIRKGGHTAPPSDDAVCEMCVRELRALACGLHWTDHPDEGSSATDNLCISLNDASWPSDEDRTHYCLPLALLSEETAPEGWLKAYCEQIIRQIVPIALRAAASVHGDAKHKEALEAAAARCETEGTIDAASAASYAASAASAASAAASYAASAAASAASYAASAAARAASYAASAASYAASDAASAASYAAKLSVLRLAVNLLLVAHGREDMVQP